MRLLPALLLAPVLALAAPAKKPVVVVLPIRAPTNELSQLGMLIEARTNALLDRSGQVLILDAKQVLAMGNQEGFKPADMAQDALADRVRVLIGADRAVAVALQASGQGLTLRGTVRAPGEPSAPVNLFSTASWATALEVMSDGLARAALQKAATALPEGATAQPSSASDDALKALGRCWETALKQPMGIDSPVGLAEKELLAAADECRAALKADPALRYAAVTLAMLLAIARADAEAEALLGPRGDDDPALVPYFLANFWLLTRNVSNKAGVEFLDKLTRKHPTMLLLRAYKGSTLYSMNEHAEAVKAWNEYIALSPQAAFPRGRLASTYARLGKNKEALAAAKAGLALTPDGREATLVMAARLMDAGKLTEAEDTLAPLVNRPNPPAEPVLTLGLAYLAASKPEEAAARFQQAAERANGPRALRTKGRALYWLAYVEARSGNLEGAKNAFADSLKTGFVMTPIDPLLEPVAKELEAQGVKAPAFALPSGIYISLQPVGGDPSVPDTAKSLADTLLKERMTSIGAVFAPPDEAKAAALKVMKENGFKGYQLRPQLKPSGANGLQLAMLVMSYPELALKGEWTVKAAGGKPPSLVKAIVPRVVEDAGADLDWRY